MVANFWAPSLLGIGIFFFKLPCHWLSECCWYPKAFSHVVHLLFFRLSPNTAPPPPQSSLILLCLSRWRCFIDPLLITFLLFPTYLLQVYSAHSPPLPLRETHVPLPHQEAGTIAAVFSVLLCLFFFYMLIL